VQLNNILVLLDVDDTLLKDDKFSGDMDSVIPVLNSLKCVGSLVGLSSARPVSSLLPIYETLSLNGPIIAENGALIFANDNVLFLGKKAAVKTLKTIEESILNSFNARLSPRHRLASSVIYLDSLNRRQEKILRDLIGSEPNIYYELVDNRRKLLISEREISKGRAGLAFIEHNSLGRVYIVGDNEIPILKNDKVIYCSVANGTAEYVAGAFFVSIHSYLEGVCDILVSILEGKI
jgi:hydroxymethylpyrimidine pyrophosphatase-like HAD family hydrolase